MSKKITKYTWATYKKKLFEGQDIKTIQKRVIKMVSASKLFVDTSDPQKIGTKLLHMPLKARKDIIAAMHLHASQKVLPLNMRGITNLRPKWGLSYNTIKIGLVDKDNRPKSSLEPEGFSLTYLGQKLESEHFIGRLTKSIEAVHSLQGKALTGFIETTNILSLSDRLVKSARETLKETLEEELRYTSEDIDNEETLIYPVRLWNRVNETLRGISELKKYLTDRMLTKLERAEEQYQEIKNDIDSVFRELPKNTTGLLILSETKFIRLRSKWERLANLNLTYLEQITQEILQNMKTKT